MRFVHTADLHIGRRLGQLSLADDITHVLDGLLGLVQDGQADALVVAGDVFDAAVPPEWAVSLWDGFVCRLADAGVPLLVVGGNHDSGVRLAYGSSLAASSGIHIAGELTGEVPCVEVGDATFWLVPFVRPADVRAWERARGNECEGPLTYDAAFRLVMDSVRERQEFTNASTNVMVAHQFVTAGGAEPDRSDSERLSLGTLDNVDVSAFDGFGYVALGHVHRPQRVGRDTVRYAGSPLKYSASEIDGTKSVVVVDTVAGGEPAITMEPVEPLHDYRRERGEMAELLERARAARTPENEGSSALSSSDDYIQAVVCDDEEPLDVAARLRAVWPGLVGVDFDNARTRAAGISSVPDVDVESADTVELFSSFFSEQAGREMSPTEKSLVDEALSAVSEGEAGE